ncbi:MAG: PEP-CTERM sorting domain-containing protein [Proteobacteria bacterium]|nr:PEP-CTERM sorting domain-containing protein [Pseudomonadota bacterium]
MAGSSSQFGTFDLQTRAYSQITASTTQTLSGLAASNGQLYATSNANPALLYTLSDTGTLAAVGGTGRLISGLAFNASGTLYADDKTNSSLGTLNPSTGAYANIGSISPTSVNSNGVLAFSNGVLYAVITNGPNIKVLASLNLASGAATQIGPDAQYVGMILFDAQNVLYGISISKNLYSINTSTAALTNLGAITGSNLPGNFNAAVAAPTTSDVPEPATLGLFAIGGLALRWRGKRTR